jgi:hypothetical protein
MEVVKEWVTKDGKRACVIDDGYRYAGFVESEQYKNTDDVEYSPLTDFFLPTTLNWPKDTVVATHHKPIWFDTQAKATRWCNNFVPPVTTKPTAGRKDDSGKPRWDLLPMTEVGEAVDVLTTGAVKYEDDNWKRVPDHRSRYFSAAMRHLTAWWGGERLDAETGKSHLAHAVCCLLFLMWFDNKEGSRDN